MTIFSNIYNRFYSCELFSSLFYLTASNGSASEDSSCHKISVKEVYSATNNLNESNFIGQGIAGENYTTWSYLIIYFLINIHNVMLIF